MEENNQQNSNRVSEVQPQINTPTQQPNLEQTPQVQHPQKKWYFSPVSILAYIITSFSLFIYFISQDTYALTVMGMGLILLSVQKYKGHGTQDSIKTIDKKKLRVAIIFSITLTLLLTAGIIWYVSDQNRQKELSDKITTDVTSPYNTTIEPKAENTSLKDWNVIGDLPANIATATYQFQGDDFVVIRSAQLANEIRSIDCGDFCIVNDEVNLIGIKREEFPTDIYGNKLPEPYSDTFKKIGGNYYRLSDVHGAPPTSPTASEQLAINKLDEYYGYGVIFFNSLREIE
ncbi:hypothetical protein KBB49_03305 [Candidatus Saccharibacteria bacterium]|nr:hypothetical protein [Candidatus Saccharibacteria bacterium]